MSTFSCPVVRVSEVVDHPNADRLSIVRLEGFGYTCISAKLADGSPRYKTGNWVVYIPSASVLPEWLLKDMEFWNEETGKGTLAGSDGNRVKPLKLRGVFSEGVLFPVKWDDELALTGGGSVLEIPDPTCPDAPDLYIVELGENVAEVLGITKWEPPIPTHLAGEVASVPEAAFRYDFERVESVPDIFERDELVVATEKLHGTCCIIQYFPDMDHPEMFSDHAGYRSITVSSKGLGGQGLVFKNNEANANNLYVRTLGTLLADHGLAELLHSMSKVDGGAHPVAVLGEVFGKGVQDLDYGTTKPTFRVFDMRIGREWLSPDAIAYWGQALPCVPTLYTGPFDQTAIEAVRDGVTTVGGTNVREGVVVRSLVPWDHPIHGRRIAKFISPAYLLRKVKGGEATEYQ
jgi:RNA ligase (TIGR02306 family)